MSESEALVSERPAVFFEKKENSGDGKLVGLTVAGAFGFLLGLIFRKKDG